VKWSSVTEKPRGDWSGLDWKRLLDWNLSASANSQARPLDNAMAGLSVYGADPSEISKQAGAVASSNWLARSTCQHKERAKVSSDRFELDSRDGMNEAGPMMRGCPAFLRFTLPWSARHHLGSVWPQYDSANCDSGAVCSRPPRIGWTGFGKTSRLASLGNEPDSL